MGDISTVQIEKFRRFSRLFTQKLRMLDEHLEGAKLSLTEASIIDVIGRETILTSKALCERLRLDPGYVSRILTGFEKRELIHKRASATDRRSIDIVLTSKGRKLYDHLESSTGEAIGRMLAGMPGEKRAQMLRAMDFVERAFESPDVSEGVSYRSPDPTEISWIVYRQAVVYWEEYKWDQKFESLLHYIADEFIKGFKPDRERAWIAEYGGEAVGSIILAEQDPGIAQLRLLYVEPHVRGKGIGKKLLDKAIVFAREKEYRSVCLWTNDALGAARNMYAFAGFKKIETAPLDEYGEGLTAELWEKQLTF